jgi:hypothetical protein
VGEGIEIFHFAIPEKNARWLSVHPGGSNHIASIESPVRCYFRAIATKDVALGIRICVLDFSRTNSKMGCDTAE